MLRPTHFYAPPEMTGSRGSLVYLVHPVLEHFGRCVMRPVNSVQFNLEVLLGQWWDKITACSNIIIKSSQIKLVLSWECGGKINYRDQDRGLGKPGLGHPDSSLQLFDGCGMHFL